ncbi:MAG: 1-deoxy-D-xylulose-5-phosphate synthase [Oscillospiraceae bacterium]|jgi:1-deoxy-D-xylulose-5-phosphate synthase|nr:1-deoxy-D-xylulose-5-phosphate synthase [Oscillospiraceae bacterium]
MDKSLLDRITGPEALKRLGPGNLERLCKEIRDTLIESVSQNGGHLASNLGVVELTVALHRVFESPADQIVWDVGHQCYTHKLLTGRRDLSSALRRADGISGFPRPSESEHDPFVSGHASTSLSVAGGIARSKELLGEKGHVIAVIGDGALTGGMAFEGLNSLAQNKDGRVIVILNDNEMSISKNVGGFTKYLSRLRTNSSYYKLKDVTKSVLQSIPLMGDSLTSLASGSVAQIKNLVYHSDFFEDLGYSYMGPVDGHDLSALQDSLRRARGLNRPVLLHVRTVKGKGYTYAEQNPGAWHGVAKFDPKYAGEPLPLADSFSDVFGRRLTELAEENDRIVAVTAAMKYATGLYHFSRRFKKSGRFFDVGIAEGHGIAFCAAMASKGLVPVMAVYSTFLQRGYDQLLHDCAIDRRHIVLAVDRAGLVGEDGETHQGIFDCAFLSTVPGAAIYSPVSYKELELCLGEAVAGEGIQAVRYPRGGQCEPDKFDRPTAASIHIDSGSRETLIVTYGRIFAQVAEARRTLPGGDRVSIIRMTKIWPLDKGVLGIAARYERIIFVEEGISAGGIGEHFLARLSLGGYRGKTMLRAIENRFVPQGTVAWQMKTLRLDAGSLAEDITRFGREGR